MRGRGGVNRQPQAAPDRLPVELCTEAPEPRRNDRRRLQEIGGRTPIDVLGGVGVRQVVAVDERRQRSALGQPEPLFYPGIDENDVVLLTRADRLGQKT